MAKMTPEREAAYALDYGVARSDLSEAARPEYDRLAAMPRAAGSRACPSARPVVRPVGQDVTGGQGSGGGAVQAGQMRCPSGRTGCCCQHRGHRELGGARRDRAADGDPGHPAEHRGELSGTGPGIGDDPVALRRARGEVMRTRVGLAAAAVAAALAVAISRSAGAD